MLKLQNAVCRSFADLSLAESPSLLVLRPGFIFCKKTGSKKKRPECFGTQASWPIAIIHAEGMLLYSGRGDALNVSSKRPCCCLFLYPIAVPDFFLQYLFWQEVGAERVLARVWEDWQPAALIAVDVQAMLQAG